MIEIKPDIKVFTWAFKRMQNDVSWMAIKFRLDAAYKAELRAIEKAMR